MGLTSVLIGEATADEALIETEVPNLSLLPCGPIPPNPAELLHSQKASELMVYLRTQFDRIVFDSPPISAVTDALALGPQLDGVVLVVRVRQTAIRPRGYSVSSARSAARSWESWSTASSPTTTRPRTTTPGSTTTRPHPTEPRPPDPSPDTAVGPGAAGAGSAIEGGDQIVERPALHQRASIEAQ